MTDESDYQYPIKPLPTVRPFGGNAASNAAIPNVDSPNVPIANAVQAPGPFDNGEGDGGGGGGGTTPTCATSWDIGTVNTSQINLPCASPVSQITDQVISLTDGTNTISMDTVTGEILIESADKSIELSITNNSITVSNASASPTRSITLDTDDISSNDAPVMQARALDVCHMGAPGLRDFICGDAYTPP